MQENAASIFQATQKYNANWVVCGTQAAVVFKALNGFEAAADQTVAGPHLIGTVDGMKVFVDPSYEPTAYVLGWKGGSSLESGAFYCPYMPVSSTDLIMSADFRGERGWEIILVDLYNIMKILYTLKELSLYDKSNIVKTK